VGTGMGMGMDVIDSVATAGAYVVLDGRFPFMVGLTPAGDRLAVVRLGGHRECGESPWQCAARELLEESGLRIEPLRPPDTYWLQPDSDSSNQDGLVSGGWPPEPSAAHPPLLVVRGTATQVDRLSIMYLARAEGTPAPLNEAHGLLLLSPAEVFGLVSKPITLAQHLRAGGRALFRDELPLDLPLAPHLQLRVLASLLARHPGLAAARD
jgi:8-oxo-dGTP pyrophosphatase MutT (NUDIX family)